MARTPFAMLSGSQSPHAQDGLTRIDDAEESAST